MDSKIKEYLDNLFHLNRQPFISNDATDEILKKSGGRGHYGVIQVDLSVANTDKEVKFSGDRFLVTQLDRDVDVRFGDLRNPKIPLSRVGVYKHPFKRFYLDNSAGSSGDLLKILVGAKGMFEPWPLRYPIQAEVTPRPFKLEHIDLSDGTTVAHAPSSNTQTLTPPAGKIYKIKDIYYTAITPAGSLSGTHGLDIQRVFVTTDRLQIRTKAVFGSTVGIFHGTLSGDNSEIPDDKREQHHLIRYGELSCSNSYPVKFTYTNSTDADQVGTRVLEILVEVYDEVV